MCFAHHSFEWKRQLLYGVRETNVSNNSSLVVGQACSVSLFDAASTWDCLSGFYTPSLLLLLFLPDSSFNSWLTAETSSTCVRVRIAFSGSKFW
jgi:hypothetical protein